MNHQFKIVFLSLLLIPASYFGFRSYRIGSQHWKYSDDAAILGDFPKIDFKIHSLFNDTLYQNGTPVAKIVSYQYRITDDVMTIESIDGKELGRYCSK